MTYKKVPLRCGTFLYVIVFRDSLLPDTHLLDACLMEQLFTQDVALSNFLGIVGVRANTDGSMLSCACLCKALNQARVGAYIVAINFQSNVMACSLGGQMLQFFIQIRRQEWIGGTHPDWVADQAKSLAADCLTENFKVA